MRLAQFLHEARWWFPIISKRSYCCLGSKPQTEAHQKGQDSSPSVLRLQQPLYQQRCLLFPALLSHAKAPVCVKQTHLYLPLRPGGQSSDTQSVPKVRRLNWGAASQFRPVYTLYPKNAICTKAGSHNNYFFLILPNQKLYRTWDYRKASCKGSHLMHTLLPPLQEKMLHTETGKILFFLLLTFPVTRKTH